MDLESGDVLRRWVVVRRWLVSGESGFDGLLCYVWGDGLGVWRRVVVGKGVGVWLDI